MRLCCQSITQRQLVKKSLAQKASAVHTPGVSARNPRHVLLAGLFVLIGLVCLGALVLQFGRFQERGIGTYPLHVTFQNTAGLVEGSEVVLGGARIGRVSTEPTLTKNLRTRVTLQIRENVQIATGSEFSVGSVGLLGDKLVDILPPAPPFTGTIAPGSELIGTTAAGLETLQKDVSTVIDQAVTALETFDRTAARLDQTLTGFDRTLTSLNTGFLSEKNSEHFSQSMAKLDLFLTDLNEVGEDLEPTLADLRETLSTFDKTARTADKTLLTADEQLQALKPAIADLQPAARSLRETSEKAGEVLDQLGNDQSLLSEVTSPDGQVASDTRQFVRNLKRYGILRYRDDETEPEPDPRSRFKGRRR